MSEKALGECQPDGVFNEESARKALEKVVNSHGHGLQYAVARKIEELIHCDPQFPWRIAAVEFPVQVRGDHTRIDIVLRHISLSLYAACECKRVNPSLAEWCFLRSPYPTPSSASHHILVESIGADAHGNTLAFAERPAESAHIYHLGVEMKSDKPGDPFGHGRGGIEGAATQVLREVNGLAEFLGTHRHLLKYGAATAVLPVIFTTASLFTTDFDIGSANLTNGEVNLSQAKIEKRGWVFYQYHQTPGLKHEIAASSKKGNLAEILQAEYTRTIAIVNAGHLSEFFEGERGGFLG